MQKIYAVKLDSRWNCCDDGYDESNVLAIFTTKDLAVRFIVKEIEDIKKAFIDKHEQELEGVTSEGYIEQLKSKIERIKNFEYDAWAIRKDEYVDVSDLVEYEWMGDSNVYSIDEYDLLDELPE